MRVWIDADACPRLARDLVVKFALKRNLEVLMVAGQAQAKPPFACVQLIVVPSGPDAADDYIVEHAQPNELVICSDIPLADRLVKNSVAVLDPRGNEFSDKNMGERLALRNLFTDLRDTGQMTGGPRGYSEQDKQAFANSLDRIITRLQREKRV
ncbi:MAG: YaiI/YqxD family protein [Gammaproteobacteria bacterium]|nr:YaiI/YqxD family protein [Thiopseudomonas sp.]MCK9465155.1 YaiI/YqxD family protein [Thiopseudomonas sp.]NLC09338.1 YaiI/YqxD family protein [Gammaproteobacteria bacterium]